MKRFVRYIASAAGACLLSACATTAPAGKTIILPAERAKAYANYHYAPAVRVGDTLILSGIPAARGATYEEKIRNMFEDVKRILEASGASMDDVVELTTFHQFATDNAAFVKEFPEFLKVHKEYFKSHYPAWTAVGTPALLARDAPVEMRVVAVIGSGKLAAVQVIPKSAP